LARLTTTSRFCKLDGSLDLGKNLPRLLQKRFTGRRQSQLLLETVKQLRLKFVLQVVDLPAQWRL
jgi:hypothetical protein